MAYKLHVTSKEKKDFGMVILADPNDSFLSLHDHLQNELKFDLSQMASFFIMDENGHKTIEITLIDMLGEEDAITMENTQLGDFIHEFSKHIIYQFDYFSDRSLSIELTESIGTSESQLPKTILKEGSPPDQMASDINELFDV